MEKKKIVEISMILIGLLILLGILFFRKNEPPIPDKPDFEIPEEKIGNLEEIRVSGYHLVTYEQSANQNSLIQTLNIKAETNENIRFVIGTIDDEGKVHERMSFEVACQKGENAVDLLAERYFIKQGEYLLMDLFGQDLLYKQEGVNAQTLVQTESNKKAGQMLMTQSDFILPFKYTLQKAQEYNVLVIGNDITTKNGGKGIAATDETRDFYTLTKTRLENTFPKVNMNRINAVEWELPKVIGTRKDWLEKNLKKDTISKLDLVIFQLGDNIQQEQNFEENVTELVEWIRTVSPNTEMLWVGMWDINEKILNALPGICERLAMEFVNISDLVVPEYQSLVTQELNEVFYPNNEAMQIISNRIIQTLKFDF